jgi:RNA polymerase sigma factor (sigma-70 family)
MQLNLLDLLADSVVNLHKRGMPDHVIARKQKADIRFVRKERRRLGLEAHPAASRLTDEEIVTELNRWSAFIWQYAQNWGRSYPELNLEDLHSEALCGCMKAVEKFDPRRGLVFTTYAANWMRNYLQNYVQRELAGGVKLASNSRITRIPRQGIPDDATFDEMFAASEEVDTHREEATSDFWDELTAGLTATEKTILSLRYREGKTNAEIAKSLGITGRQVKVVLTESVGWLRRQGRDVTLTG